MRPGADGSVAAHQPHCMGCGPENPAGLGMRFRVVGDRATARLTLDRRHEGSPGFAHGGALATALDDLLGAVLVILERPAVTASLTVDYRAPASLHRPYDLEGWCERIDGRKLHLAGTIKDGEILIAEARALFIQVELAHFQQSGQPLPEGWGGWGRQRDATSTG